MTARATARLDADPKGAKEDAKQALKLDEDFVPAGLIAAKACLREDNLRKAASILEKLWKSTGHPEVAKLYVRARSGDSAADRLKRAEKLEAMRPNNAEALFVVAEAALETRDFALARAKAEAAARLSPRESAFLLLADIEDAETGDQGRIRHWMNQALKAPRDPAWTADGITSAEWLPVSPVSGRLDAFEWKTPVSQIEGPLEEGSANPADEAIRTLPPLAIDSRAEAPAETAAVEEEAPVIEAPPAEESRAKDTVVPLKSETPAAKVAEEKKEEEELEAARPFFGLPDDPGVKEEAKRDGTSGFRLF